MIRARGHIGVEGELVRVAFLGSESIHLQKPRAKAAYTRIKYRSQFYFSTPRTSSIS